MRALIGRKLGMTQIFADNGAMVPVTLVEAGPCVITQIRTQEKDGYAAVQLGYGQAKKLSRSLSGHFKQSKSNPKIVKEMRLTDVQKEATQDEASETAIQVGDKWDLSLFKIGDSVTLSGISKGKGFAGTIKRHNFHRGPKTHGSRSYRRPGSIGSMYPQKIWKGKAMAGRMGHDQTTLQNATITDIDQDLNLVAIKGAIPGPRGNILVIKGSSNG